jgi:hypothetical protein
MYGACHTCRLSLLVALFYHLHVCEMLDTKPPYKGLSLRNTVRLLPGDEGYVNDDITAELTRGYRGRS